jgi:uncharacterized peroxidase-related enzyme
MAFIELPDRDGTNFERAFSHRPDVYAAWRGLVGAITANMDERLYELVTLAAARELRSSYCCLAHGRVLATRILEPDTVTAAVRDPRSAGLEPVEVAAMELAAKLVRDATAITESDVDELRRLGLGDAEILDVAAAAGARCFFSKTLDALGVQPDREYADLEPAELREALVTGRPIAEGSNL